ncbi:MAG TPA: hypothetical protein VK607_04195, partial [Kofleriaceae bacterium]|nr:hypothetical protein [Kofleriaceae bacterium]
RSIEATYHNSAKILKIEIFQRLRPKATILSFPFKSCEILRLTELAHRQRTTNPEVIHKDSWFSPTAMRDGLSTGEETSRS